MDFHINRAIVEALDCSRVQTANLIADLAGMSAPTVSRHMKKLIASGVVARQGTGKRGSYRYVINRPLAVESGYLPAEFGQN